MVESEKVVTASMLDAMTWRIVSTASAPIFAEMPKERNGVATTEITAEATASSEISVARNHRRRVTSPISQRKRGVIAFSVCAAPGFGWCGPSRQAAPEAWTLVAPFPNTRRKIVSTCFV